MRTSKLWFSLAAAGLVMVSLAGTARADGIGVESRHLKAPERTALKAQVSKARHQNAAIFAKVAEAPKLAIEADQMKRGRAASITLPLRALGNDALFPMLEMLALDGPTRGTMPDSTWTTLRVGLIEAVGLIRDPRATAVLSAIVERETQFEVVYAAAEALGRIGDDASAKKLVRWARGNGPKRVAVMAALGECRRTVAATALAKLANTSDETQLLIVIKSLGTVGNAWAWQTAEISKSGEGAPVRAIAAQALMAAFMKSAGYTRAKAERALLVVDDPSTPALIAAARKNANADQTRALDALATRVAQNPAR
ncbi:MAG: HEAT repeat domain-containing protein [Polyangiaceae bacterium]|nr:HEAT repeat domain-containing protein [Polyangiaceae bacterium]